MVTVAAFAFYSKDLPSPDRLSVREQALSTKIFDRNGQILYDFYGEQNRTLVKLGDLPEYLIRATLAAEDSDFYTHRGFDIPGILRAFYNVLVYRKLQGGSTITQQLVRNTVITRERTITRKIKEFILALQIERKYNKDEILQMYLNEAPYGGQAYGVQAASEVYFGKNARELTLAEAALLAGLPQAPSRYSPYRDPELAEGRKDYVVHLMEKRGCLGKDGRRYFLPFEEAKVAKEAPLDFSPPGGAIKAPHFVMYAKEILTERYGANLVEQGGLQVTTTLDLEKQEKMQQIVTEEIDKVRGYQIGNGALLAVNSQTGEILAMVGSADFFDEERDGQVNVTLRPRQPGSSIKPVTYATAFKQGYTPATVIFDVPTTFPGGGGQPDYKPVNYDGKWRGPMALRYALGNSINMVAVKLLKLVGINEMLATAHDLGITTFNDPSRYGLSLTLGGGEVKLIDMVTTYSTFAAGGRRHDPVAILEVKDSAGHILEKFQPTEGQKVLSEEIAYLISDILSDNRARTLAFGPASYLHIPGYSVAVKTGTTNDMRDNWTIGYTRSFAVGVWVGNNDNSPMSHVASGITGASPIWNRAMKEFLSGKPDEPFLRPEDKIVEIKVCPESGQLPQDWCREPSEEERKYCQTRNEKFIKGTEPTKRCEVHQKLEVCEKDGKLASEACREVGKVKKKIFVNYQAQLPEWQEFVNRWIGDVYGDDDRYDPPTEVSTRYFHPDDKDEPWVKIEKPDSDEVGLEFEVEVKVISPYTITKVKFYFNGQEIGSVSSIPYKKKYKLDMVDVGEGEIKVKAYDSGGNVGDAKKKVTVIGPEPTPSPTPFP